MLMTVTSGILVIKIILVLLSVMVIKISLTVTKLYMYINYHRLQFVTPVGSIDSVNSKRMR